MFEEMKNEIQNQLILGEFTDTAALKIQRCVKNFLWRRKIRRIKFVFENYYLKSTKTFLIVFSNALTCWAYWNRIKTQKFLNFRKMRLKIIREKLALITIKKAMKEKRVSLVVAKKMYRRLNRRRRLLLSRKSNDTGDTPLATPRTNIQILLQELENESLENNDQKPVSKTLQLSRLLYGIKNTENNNFAPLLAGKYYCHTITPPANTILIEREQQNYRTLMIATPPIIKQRRAFGSSENASRLMLYSIKAPYDSHRPRPLSSSSQKVSENMNFLKPTEIFIRKISADKEEEAKANIRIRPPSRRLTRNTISSMAKRSIKKAMNNKQIIFGKRETKTVDKIRLFKDGNASFSNYFNNWNSFDASNASNLIRKEL